MAHTSERRDSQTFPTLLKRRRHAKCKMAPKPTAKCKVDARVARGATRQDRGYSRHPDFRVYGLIMPSDGPSVSGPALHKLSAKLTRVQLGSLEDSMAIGREMGYREA